MTGKSPKCACGNRIGPRNKTGRCGSCAASERNLKRYQDYAARAKLAEAASIAATIKYAVPANRKKMSIAKKRALKDPVKYERVATAAAATFRRWHEERRRNPAKMASKPKSEKPITPGVDDRERRKDAIKGSRMLLAALKTFYANRQRAQSGLA